MYLKCLWMQNYINIEFRVLLEFLFLYRQFWIFSLINSFTVIKFLSVEILLVFSLLRSLLLLILLSSVAIFCNYLKLILSNCRMNRTWVVCELFSIITRNRNNLNPRDHRSKIVVPNRPTLSIFHSMHA